MHTKTISRATRLLFVGYKGLLQCTMSTFINPQEKYAVTSSCSQGNETGLAVAELEDPDIGGICVSGSQPGEN